jgi:hypothetical protein
MRRAIAEHEWDEQPLAPRQRRVLRVREDQSHNPDLPPPIPRTAQPQAASLLPGAITTDAPGPPERKVRSALVTLLLGFVLGALFWHFVGFWDFVGQVMFKGKSTGSEITQAPPPIKLKERVSGVSPLAITLEPERCVTLELDRTTGLTSSAPCDVQALPLRSLRTARREDRWVTAGQRIQEATSKGWAFVTVETPVKGISQASAD